jgi:serine beta-lactamase-like protein LACTB
MRSLAGRVVFVALAACIGGVSVAQSHAPSIAEAVEACRTERDIPGIGWAVVRSDGEVEAGGVGLADIENAIPVTERTVFRLASISKPIAAVAVLRAVERGEFDLDRPVHEIVEAFPEKRWPVTTRQLLGHLGGVRAYRGREIDSNVRYPSVASALVIFAADPLLHAPGSVYRYSTYGYNLAGAALEQALHRPFAEIVAADVLVPSDCVTLVVDDSAAIVPHRARGYRRLDGELANSHPVDVTNKVPGGGYCGTPTDLCRFAHALASGQLLGEELRDAMWTSQTTADGKATGYGLGWTVRAQGDARIVSHGGAQPQVSTILVLDPERRTAVALMANLEEEGKAIRALAERLLGELTGTR